MDEPDHALGDRRRALIRAFLWWQLATAAAFRGYWMVTSLYLVVVADLSPFELVILGTAMEVTVLVSEIPTGVLADTVSRRWSLVVSHVLMGGAMLATGLTTDVAVLVATQMLWGLGWTFSSGADIAWITDELDDRARIDRVLAAAARYRQYGAIGGMVATGLLGWATSLATSIVVAGAVMIALAGAVARFTEHGFEPTRERRWAESRATLRRGVALARGDREILLILAVTLLINSGAEAFDRLHPKRLIDLGFPGEPVLWFMALGIALLAVGATALRIVEARIEGDGVPRRVMLVACLSGAIGMVVLAHAPDDAIGVAGTVMVGGVAWTLIRSVSSIWVNRRTTSDVRATVHSFLGQTESVGEITGGIVMAILAQSSSITVALTASGAMLAVAAAVLFRTRSGRAQPFDHRAEHARGHVA